MTGRIFIEAHDRISSYRLDLDNARITSNHEMLHCTGGTVLHLVGEPDGEVCIILTDEHIIELRDKLNGIIKWKGLEEER